VEADPSRTRDRLPSVVPLPVSWVGYTCTRARGKRCRFGGSRVRGVGTDIVAVSRLARSLRRRDGFAETVFCSDERRFCDSQRYPEHHYAARFAAKEAFLKALGLGIFSGIALTDIEVVRDRECAPQLRLGPTAAAALARVGGKAPLLSMSHHRHVALAIVVVP
jgi:holo-[acyl-carrier protein] synthase